MKGYSARNYATRLIGSRLILYSPLPLRLQGADPLDSLPALRRWTPGVSGGEFRRITTAQRVYIPRPLREGDNPWIDTLHSVTHCDLTAPVLECEATAVLGGDSRTFFVSANAVYLWNQSGWGSGRSYIYRMPFDGGRPAAVQARGFPIDQFSFGPDPRRQALNVLVKAEGGGDAMWRPEASNGDLALLRLPMASFGDGSREAPLDRYQPLPSPGADAWRLQNRYVGDHLLYGAGGGGTGALTVVSLTDGRVAKLALPHAVDRIDIIGRDGIVIGSGDGALGFTTVKLSADAPRLGERFRLADAQEGETRSHAFFFHSDADSPDGGSGLLGLPVSRSIPAAFGRPYLGRSAGVLFLTRRSDRLAEAGQLNASHAEGQGADDACQASCVDWYGNARPIFIGERVLALLGYELVEGRRTGGRIREIGRENFAPSSPSELEQGPAPPP